MASAAHVLIAILLTTSGNITAQTANQETSPWNAATGTGTSRAKVSGPADGTLGLTVYQGLVDGVRLPGHASRQGRAATMYATDVVAVVTRCADGRELVTALVIGGRLTPLENHCDESSEVHKLPRRPTCDANAWTCP